MISQYKKGNTTIVVIVVVIVLAIIAYLVFKPKATSAPTTPSANDSSLPSDTNGAGGSQVQSGTSAQGGASIDAQLNAVDQNVSSMSQDSANIDSSLNDTPVAQPQ